ncbi:MAG: tRNA guanosine(34) transglycosylase Tgt [Pseudomonadota bacterium]
MTGFEFKIVARDKGARRGEITLPRGVIRTPAFMPVGTQGTVKAMFPETVAETGADILLGNTYHLMLRPGAERVAALGGLHSFMRWQKPILTDSGGFQVMSLSDLRKVTEEGVLFRSHVDGAMHDLTPERAMEIQALLGSDIQMQLDELIGLPAERDQIERAMRLSLRWAERCKTAFDPERGQALFGIVQGGDDPALRRQSAEGLVEIGFPGYAIGGLAVGEPQDVMFSTLEATLPFLPDDAPHYLMGVGTPDDILGAIARGVDMFDCVMPTRAGRHGQVFTRFGKLNLKNARHQDDPRPLDETSDCEAARTYSRAYLHHLVRSGELLAGMILSWVNVAYYQSVMAGSRDAVSKGVFGDYADDLREGWARGDLPPVL